MKIAAVQMDVRLGEPEANLRQMLEHLHATASAGTGLTVFPECALTGYCFDSLDEARPHAQPIPGPATQRLSGSCAELGTYAVFGMLEAAAGRVFNTAVLVGPQGVIGTYRKVHLPYLGVDRFTAYGDRPFAVCEAGGLRVGMLICYDAAFPEAPRSLALRGADLIVLPTNWPPGGESVAEHAINTRAMENNVYFVAANRVGSERGFRFIGRSRICDPAGTTLAVSEDDRAKVLEAEIDPEKARNKRLVRVPEKHVIDRMADRRPEMYGLLTEPHDLARPGREE